MAVKWQRITKGRATVNAFKSMFNIGPDKHAYCS